jgi:TolB-like protein/Tfp pilus assembly protein PilF
MKQPFPAYIGDEPYVFMTYAHSDSAVVFDELVWLKNQGIRIWYDEGIEAGTLWREEIAKAIRHAHVVLFFLTPNSAASENCRNEINFGLDQKIPMIAVHLEPTELSDGLKMSLSEIQGILKHEITTQKYQDKLVSRITTYLGKALTPPLVSITPPATQNSIAVLPLTNLSPVAENAYFCDGIHDEVLNQLSKISAIRVISRTATLRYRDTTETTREIAQNLNVSLIMEGSVRYAGNRVRIHTQLVRARDDTQLWSEIYESELDDIFSIQSDVALRVASAMHARLMPDEIARIERPATSSVEAYTLFLRTIARENQESYKITGAKDGWIETGLRDLNKAVQLDPEFARCYAQMGSLQILKRYTVAFDIKQSNHLLAEAKANAKKALSIDSSIVQAYSVLASVAFERHNWVEWEKLELKSAALPNAKSGVLLNFAERLGRLGRFDEALNVIDRSIILDPVRAHNREYATYYQLLGRHYASALTTSEHYRMAGGDEGGYHLYRATAYYFLGQLAEARREFNAITGDLAGTHLNSPIFYAFLHSRLESKEAAERYVAQQESPVAKEFADFGYALGSRDFDQAFENLKGYIKGGHVVSDLGEILAEIKRDSRWQMVVDYMATPIV